MSVLITGAAGFIGAALVQRFIQEGHSVLAFDFSEPLNAVRAAWGKDVEFVQGDIRDPDLIQALVEKTDSNEPIIHLAAILTAGCDHDPVLGCAVNVGGTYNVLNSARQIGGRRVVLASTIGVYGRGLSQPIDETRATEPDGWYGYTKTCAEQMGMLYVRRYGMDFRAARLAAVTGPFRKAKGSASLFTSLIAEKAALGEAYAIEVTEDTAYPVVYIKDCVEAIVGLATVQEAPRRIYNISSDRVVVSEMIAYVREKIPEARFFFEPDSVIMKVVGGYKEWCIDCSRIHEDLGWQPAYNMNAMVDDIIATVRGM